MISVSAQSTITFENTWPAPPSYKGIISYNGVNHVTTLAQCSTNYALQFPNNSSYIIIGPLQNTNGATLTVNAYNGSCDQKYFDITFSNDTSSFFHHKKRRIGYNQVGCSSSWVVLPSTQYSYMKIKRRPNYGGNLLYITKITISNGVLPVELVSFNAIERNGNISLKWETATETNNYGFDIMKSRDSVNWSTIGFVMGNGTKSSSTYYSYTDNNTMPGINYYRLRQVDRDGTYEYSNVVITNVKPYPVGLDVDIYPNPTSDVAIFNTFIANQTNVRVEVLNYLGQVISVLYDGNVSYSTISVRLNLGSYPDGTYYVRVMTPANNVITMVNKY